MIRHAEQSDLPGLDLSLCVRVEYQESRLAVVTDPVPDSAVWHAAAEPSAFAEKPEARGLALDRHPLVVRPHMKLSSEPEPAPWYTGVPGMESDACPSPSPSLRSSQVSPNRRLEP